jgi:hypothetical protein
MPVIVHTETKRATGFCMYGKAGLAILVASPALAPGYGFQRLQDDAMAFEPWLSLLWAPPLPSGLIGKASVFPEVQAADVQIGKSPG